MNRFLIAFIALCASTSLVATEGFSSLEEQMTGKEFMEAGLGKLTPEELAALNAWIRARSLATIDAPVAGTAAAATSKTGDQRGFKSEKKEEDRTPIHSRIVGSFNGWDGQSVFRLANGMIWEQADKDKFYTREIENPEIVIEPGMFGTWRLSVVGFNSNCRVERIQ